MASISFDKKNGRRTIQFIAPDGRRKSVRIGKADYRQAQEAKRHVEELLTCLRTGSALKPLTTEWVSSLPNAMRVRLERSGLMRAREIGGSQTPTLADWIETYISGRTDLKPSSLVRFDQIGKKLNHFFGKGKRLNEISAGAAEDFRIHLRRTLSESSTRRQCGLAKQVLQKAIRGRIIAENPFAEVKCANFTDHTRFHFISRADAKAVLNACPDHEWRLIFALCRYGALRCPSEVISLRWSDVDWDKMRFTVHAIKTEHHEDAGIRQVPMFPELYPYLRDAFELAEPGTDFVITRYRKQSVNLRTQLTKIITRAGLVPWPKLFVNLRSTRVTELCEKFPSHVVASWAGHSEQIAREHYLQTTEEHFEKALQNPVQQGAESGRTEPQEGQGDKSKTAFFDPVRGVATPCETAKKDMVGAGGFEPPKAYANGFTARPLWPLGHTPIPVSRMSTYILVISPPLTST